MKAALRDATVEKATIIHGGETIAIDTARGPSFGTRIAVGRLLEPGKEFQIICSGFFIHGFIIDGELYNAKE